MADLIEREALMKDMKSDCPESYVCIAETSCIECIIGRQPAVNRWIPCSEKLPHGGRVLATTKQGYVVDVIFVLKGSQWFRNGEYFPTDTVIAWMPMPDAYEPPEEE